MTNRFETNIADISTKRVPDTDDRHTGTPVPVAPANRRGRLSRRASVAALLLAGGLSIAACSNGEATPPPTGISSSPATAPSTPTVPTSPSIAPAESVPVNSPSGQESQGGSTPSHTTASACSFDETQVGFGSSTGTAGHTEVQLKFTNGSRENCSFYGYPGVSLVGANGKQIGQAARRNTAITPSTVVLSPGATAVAILSIADATAYPNSGDPGYNCGQEQATGLVVYPPNDYSSDKLPDTVIACADTDVDILTVGALQTAAAAASGS